MRRLLPLSGNDIGVFTIAAVAVILASGAGVGSGVLMLPTLLVVGRFDEVTAVALSSIPCSTIANVGCNMFRRSPVGKGPLTNWDIVLLFSPTTMAGATAGSFINKLIPGWVTSILLLGVLIPITWRSVSKVRPIMCNSFGRPTSPETVELQAPEAGLPVDNVAPALAIEMMSSGEGEAC
jgi:uncharacterized membrane protein YfcA